MAHTKHAPVKLCQRCTCESKPSSLYHMPIVQCHDSWVVDNTVSVCIRYRWYNVKISIILSYFTVTLHEVPVTWYPYASILDHIDALNVHTKLPAYITPACLRYSSTSHARDIYVTKSQSLIVQYVCVHQIHITHFKNATDIRANSPLVLRPALERHSTNSRAKLWSLLILIEVL